MKHHDIVGWTLPGCAFCEDCEPDDQDEKSPIFAGNEGWKEWACDSCGEPLDPDRVDSCFAPYEMSEPEQYDD